MEDIKSYIESGILELYVLGDLNAEERSAVEAMSKQYPEVKTELEDIEKAMSGLSENLAIEPSEKVREGFFNSISFSDETVIETPEKIVATEEAKIVSISVKKLNFYKFSFAACFALLLVSLFAIINLNKNLSDSRQQIAQLQTSNETFSNRVIYLDQQVAQNNDAIAI